MVHKREYYTTFYDGIQDEKTGSDKILIYATFTVAKLEFKRSLHSLKEERRKKKEKWRATHSHLIVFVLI